MAVDFRPTWGRPKVQGLGDPDRTGGLILDGKKLDARIEDSIINSTLERTIDGASTLSITVEDPERFLARGGYFSRQGDLLLDDLWFRLCALDKQGDEFTLTFEDREIALLRRHVLPRKASRNDMTRAEFAAMLVHEEPHIRFSCPQLHRKQTVAPLSSEDLLTRAQNGSSDSDRERGISTSANLKVKGVTATPAQINLANRLLRVAEGANASQRVTLALLCAAIGESNMGAEPGTYSGKYQGPLQASPNAIDPHDFEEQARSFLFGGKGFQSGGAIALAKANPSISAGEIAVRVEGSQSNFGSISAGTAFYGKYEPEAKRFLQAFGSWVGRPNDDGDYTPDATDLQDLVNRVTGRIDQLLSGVRTLADKDPTTNPQPAVQTYVQRYEFTRGEPGGERGEDTWTCILRLARQVKWRCFMVAGVVYFISDNDLIRSRPRMMLGEDSKGVDSIDYSLDTSAKKPDMVTIEARAPRWAAPPGTVIVLDQDLGPAAGAWIVSDIIRQDLWDEATTITLTRPQAPALEPASTVVTRSTTNTQDGGVNANLDGPTVPGRKAKITAQGHAIAPAAAPTAVKAMIQAGNEIVGKKYGPAQHAASSSASHPEYDCSSSIAHILLAAGLVTEGVNYVSGTFAGMYVQGPGEWVTIHANGGHVYMQVAGIWWNTHGDGPVSGIGWHPSNASPASGFAIRHPGGL